MAWLEGTARTLPFGNKTLSLVLVQCNLQLLLKVFIARYLRVTCDRI
jgi:hypothetical protein